MHYTVITNNSLDEMEKKVQELLDVGWRPQGGICVGIEENYTYYYQAMVSDD